MYANNTQVLLMLFKSHPALLSNAAARFGGLGAFRGCKLMKGAEAADEDKMGGGFGELEDGGVFREEDECLGLILGGEIVPGYGG